MAKPTKMHPGEILYEEFLVPFKISVYMLAKAIDIPQTRIIEILRCKRRVTADIALRLSKYFGSTPTFWLHLQDDYDLEEVNLTKKSLLDGIESFSN